MREPGEPAPATAAIHGPSWGARAADWAELTAAESRPAWESVADAAGIVAGVRVLDVGCGSGEFCELVEARGAAVSGIDAAEGMIDIARRVVPDAELRVGAMESLPWDDNAFDVVTGFNSFQFAADMVAALAEAGRVVRSGGKVAICNWGNPKDCDLFTVLAPLRELQPPGPPPPDPPAIGAPGVVEDLARQAGLDPLCAGEVDAPHELADREALARALLAPGGIVCSAVEAAGEAAVRRTIIEAAAPFRRRDGSYRLENRFRYVIVTA